MGMRLKFGLLTLLATGFTVESKADIHFYENASGTPLLSLLTSAQSSIDIEIYEMNDPHVDQAIRDAMDRGVRVRIVQEAAPVGASCHLFEASAAKDNADCKREKDLVKVVKSRGGSYVPFQADLCGVQGKRCYEHGKMALIDRTSAFVSTGNFNITNLCDLDYDPANCNRDYSLLDTDSNVVNALETFFEKDLNGSSYNAQDVLNQTGMTNDLTVSPFSMDPIVKLIDSAQTKLVIETQYLKDPTMNAALVSAARRGVQVFVMVSSACAFGKPTASTINQWNSTYSDFDAAGITTRTFPSAIKVNGKAGYLHAKAIVVDNQRAWVGSVNGSTTSLTDNREYGIISEDPTLVSQLYQFMVNDLNNDNAETWQDSLNCKVDHGAASSSNSDGGLFELAL